MRKKRCFTIMIIPHSEEATFSLRLPLVVGQVAVALMIVGLVSFTLLAIGYRQALKEASEVRVLREVNRAQQEEINAFAYETQKLLDQMEQIEGLAKSVSEKLGISLEEETGLDKDSRDTSPKGGGQSNHLESKLISRTAGNIAILADTLPGQSDSMENLYEEVEDYIKRLAATPSIWPTYGRYTSGFGIRRSPFNPYVTEFHRGVDIAGHYGTPIYATADGLVSSASYQGSWGNLIIISHGYGFHTYYAHLSRYAVSPGQWVTRGQVIGYMGSTGRSTGNHLHYEVHVNGVAVNPLNYMQ